MIFPYRAMLSEPPNGGDYLLIVRPEIPITIVEGTKSLTYSALVDTGSDNTILPRRAAELLGIAIHDAPGPPAIVFGGQHVQLLIGEVTLRIQSDGEVLEWRTDVYFFEFLNHEDETAILGHAGFLDYFTATFDGKLATLTLIRNNELPAA